MKIKAYTPDDYMELVGNALSKVLGDDFLIIFFDSVINGNFTRTSDIDVAVFCGRELTGREMWEIEDAIEELPILRKVDVVDFSLVKDKEFLSQVLKGRVWRGPKGLLKALRRLLTA
ncbi:MAG: nucleotidyltransferase domain-containing protein [Desulfurobacteriaceae bacterium]